MKTINNAQPDANDPQEKQIREKLRALLTTEWSTDFFKVAKVDQSNFLINALSNKKMDVRNEYLNLLEQLSEKGKTHIVYGLENLKELQDRSFVLITNHIGTAKITRIDSENLSTVQELPGELEPFPIRIAPMIKIADELGTDIHECANELPEPFARIQEMSGVVTLPAIKEGKTEILQKKISDILASKDKKHLFVMYPEGGTSGKRNSGGPYDLDVFHSGAFVIAKQTGLPILPVFQVFNPKTGFELSVLKPIFLSEVDNIDYKKIAKETMEQMQRFAPII